MNSLVNLTFLVIIGLVFLRGVSSIRRVMHEDALEAQNLRGRMAYLGGAGQAPGAGWHLEDALIKSNALAQSL